MIIVRKSTERRQIESVGHKTWMTFDWENKADPLQNGFGVLKILNEEILSPGTGFILHTNKDMVIITYLREGMIIFKGPLEDADLLWSKEFHQVNFTPETEKYVFNPSRSEDAHIIQSGFTPSDGFLKPDGVKKLFTHAERQGILKLIASADGRGGSLTIQQDVQMYSAFIHKGNHMIHELEPGRNAWLHVVNGGILMNDLSLQSGDGVGISNEISVSFTAQMPTEILLFDLAESVNQKNKSEPKKEAVFSQN
jgi:redox-sensitive bicupin YhaK (pirin superfamily)